MSKCQNQLTDDFIRKSIDIHGNKYDYTKAVYKNRTSKLTIICRTCNKSFSQAAYHHLRGSGCPDCSKQRTKNKLRLTRDQFLEKVREAHGDKYDCSLVVDWSRRSKQSIICPIHGSFIIQIGNFLNGSGCQKCAVESSSRKQLKSLEQFIKEARSIHGNLYDYIEYNGAIGNISAVCQIHGEFKQLASYHLNGGRCPKCVIDQRRLTTDRFIEKSHDIHGSKYNYSKVEYLSNKTKVTIVCPKHGEFDQEPHFHWSGHGCVQCSIEASRSTTQKFVDQANKVHNNKYDYSNSDYIRAHDKVQINCHTHGPFQQKPNNHLNGQGCPKCVSTISKPQEEIAEFIGGSATLNDRSVINPYELDIFCPDRRIAVEYHGLYWHSFDRQETFEEKMRHFNKCSMAVNSGIRLIQIFEHHYRDKKDIIYSMLSSVLGDVKRIFARKTVVVEVDSKSHNQFMNANHLYGSRNASVRLGLEYDGRLIACMSFHRSGSGWEITRYACERGYMVVGGVSRLLHYFISGYSGELITFADRMHSIANAYKKVGFVVESVTKPNYFYVKNGSVFSRQQFQKHKLSAKLADFDPTLTESQNMFNNGYRRIWDAGHFKLRYKR